MLKISTFAYCFEFIFLNEYLQVTIDHMSTMLGVKNDVDGLRNARIIFVPANFVDVIILRRYEKK